MKRPLPSLLLVSNHLNNTCALCVLRQALGHSAGDRESAIAKRASKNKSDKINAMRPKYTGRNRVAAGTGSESIDDSTQDSTSDSDSFSGTRTFILE
jgi:hypothetical protein